MTSEDGEKEKRKITEHYKIMAAVKLIELREKNEILPC